MIATRTLTNDCQTFVFIERHLAAINNLLKQLSGKIEPINMSQLHALISDYPRSVIILAEDRNDEQNVRVVGMCMIFFQPRLEGPLAEIHSVVVDDHYRGQGIGDLLTKTMLGEARKYVNLNDTSLTIYLTSKPARQAANGLYIKHDFTLVAQASGDAGTNLYKLVIEP
ncbi:MAG: GNAT family N-acetyltransferase [bacterium]|nr:GNAT family N-acetyltransferase [bacterium]